NKDNDLYLPTKITNSTKQTAIKPKRWKPYRERRRERLRRFPWMKMLICCGYFFATPFCGVFLF
ncbi:TPA: hypothetical protein ACIUKJ_002928, partial [Salmonella enterica subsp. enterica serovar Newport]